MAEEVDYAAVAAMTDGMVGVVLENNVEVAAINMMRDGRTEIEPESQTRLLERDHGHRRCLISEEEGFHGQVSEHLDANSHMHSHSHGFDKSGIRFVVSQSAAASHKPNFAVFTHGNGAVLKLEKINMSERLKLIKY
ncbi:hypothetical protein Tco_0091153 [Tanacetum coccineum]